MTEYFYVVSKKDYDRCDAIKNAIASAIRAFKSELDSHDVPAEIKSDILDCIESTVSNINILDNVMCVAYGEVDDETYVYHIHLIDAQSSMTGEECVNDIIERIGNDLINNVLINNRGKLVDWNTFFEIVRRR